MQRSSRPEPPTYLFLLGATALGISSYLIVLMIYELEDYLAGGRGSFDPIATLSEAPTVHWLSLIIAVAIALSVQTLVRRERMAVSASEERFRRLVETAQAGIWVIDARDKTTFVNEEMARLLGCTVEEMQGALWYDFVDDESKELAAQHVERCRQGISERHDFKFRRKDGAELWAMLSAAPLQNGAGEYIGAFAMVTDITERKRTEEQLRQREELLDRIFETVSEGIYVTDAKGQMTFANRAAEAILGMKRSRIAALRYDDPSWEFQTADRRPFPAEDQPSARVLRTGQPVQGVEQSIKRPDGRRLLVSINAAPLFDAQGAVVGVVGSMRDITAQRRNEEELARERNLMRNLMDNLPDLIYVKDRESRFLLANTALVHSLGASRMEEVIGKSDRDFHPPDLAAQYRADEVRVMETGIPLIGHEEPVVNPQGELRWLSSTKVPWRDHTGNVIGLVGLNRDITERKQAEKALRESEERFHSTLDGMLEGCQIIGYDWRYIYLNDAAARHGHRAKDELLGRTMTEMYPGIEQTEMFAALRQCMVERIHRRFENEFHYPDGSSAFFELSVEPVPEGIFVLSIDITARRNAEKALQQAEAKYRELVERLPVVVYTAELGAAGKWSYISPQIEPLLGFTPEEWLADPELWYRQIDSEDRDREVALEDQAYQQGISFDSEYRMHTKDGRIIWIRDSGHVLPPEDGSVPIVQGILTDITERKQAELALRATLATNEALLNALPDSMIRFGRDGTILQFRGSTSGVGIKGGECVGKNVADLLPHRLGREVQEAVARVIETRRPEMIEGKLTPNGVPHDYEARIVPCGPDEALTILRDITERKALDRMKSEFVSTVSHELRTPLTSITGSLALLTDQTAGGLSPQARTLIDIAYRNSERLVRLINDLLDMEKIDSGRMVFRFRPLELQSLVEQALEADRLYAHKYGVTLALTRRLPGILVNGDSDRLMQVMTNLISNAVKFSPRGGTVEVALTAHDNRIRAAVSDHGPGIPVEFRSRIFQRFAQADSSDARQKGGTGLGLSISKAIVEKHGGVIGFETELGVGTTFYFELPIHQPATPVTVAPENKLEQREQLQILICEDDPDIARLLEMLLSQSHYATAVAGTAAEARALLAQRHFDAMTLDLILPDEDGLSLLRELRANEATRALPIVVVSAMAAQGRAELNGDAFQVVDWLEKPIDPEHLLSAVRLATLRSVARPRILHVEDDADVVELTTLLLRDTAEVTGASTLAQAKSLLVNGFDLAIIDLQLPDGDGAELLPLLNRYHPPIPAIIFSARERRLEDSQHIAAALVKTRTSNEELLNTILAVLRASPAHAPPLAVH